MCIRVQQAQVRIVETWAVELNKLEVNGYTLLSDCIKISKPHDKIIMLFLYLYYNTKYYIVAW